MLKLYSLMTDIHGVGAAKASKVLHFKRPSLYPILDSRLMELYRDPAIAAAKQYKKRGFKRLYWAAIRATMSWLTTMPSRSFAKIWSTRMLGLANCRILATCAC